MKTVFVLAAFLLSSSAAIASTITYNFNDQAGSLSATGTITTDGTIGVLSSGDIVAYTLTVSDGSNSDTFSTGFVNSAGDNFTATATGLFFDFSTPGGGILLGETGENSEVCLTVAPINCGFITGLVVKVNGDNESDASQTGVLQVGSVESASAITPEPGSVLLLGTGALSAFGMARRKMFSAGAK
jgi:hypothetical protein